MAPEHCLSENALLDLALGGMAAEAAHAAQEHLAGCEPCRRALAAAQRSSQAQPTPSLGDTLPRERPASPLPRGAQVGRYVVLEAAGEGGMGRVYAAYDPVLDRRVALKLIHPSRADRAFEFSARLLREAQAMARVSHPNLVTVHDAGRWSDDVFLAMELVVGSTLRQWTLAKPRTAREVLSAYRQAGEGLAAAHRAGLVHRDFKPDNALVDAEGRVRVTDFGLVLREADVRRDEGDDAHREAGGQADGSASPGRASDAPRGEAQRDGASAPADPAPEALTRAGELYGTLPYMAPEQLDQGAADARSDQFSFCVALYEALYRQRPFPVPRRAVVESTVLFAERAPSPGIPARVQRALARGLSARPEDRFPSMAALLDALSPRARVRPLGLALAGALGVAILALALGFMAGGGTARARCRAGGERWGRVWSDARRQTLAGRLLALELPYGPATTKSVQDTVDAYGASWQAAYREACEATTVRGEQSERVLDARMGCLQRRLDEVDALVRVLLATDSQSLAQAAQAASELTRVAACADVPRLLAAVPEPERPEDALQARRILQSVAQVRALKAAGRYPEALPLARAASLEANALEHAPTQAEALLLRGQVQLELTQAQSAKTSLREAYVAANAGRHDRVAAEAAIDLMYVEGELDSHLAQGEEWGFHARAALKRLGGDAELQAQLANQEGHALFSRGEYAAAVERYQEALRQRQAVHGDHHPATAAMWANLARAQGAAGDHEAAFRGTRRALDTFLTLLGPAHPQVLRARNGLASTLLNLGRNDEALDELQRALAFAEPTLGAEHLDVGRMLANLATAELRAGHPQRAEQAALRARGILSAQRQSAALVELLLTQSDAQHELSRDAEALESARAAQALASAELSPDHELLAVALEATGDLLLIQGRAHEALARFDEAYARRVKVGGEGYFENAFSLSGQGRAYLALGQPRLAVQRLTRARALLADAKGDPSWLHDVEVALAEAQKAPR